MAFASPRRIIAVCTGAIAWLFCLALVAQAAPEIFVLPANFTVRDVSPNGEWVVGGGSLETWGFVWNRDSGFATISGAYDDDGVPPPLPDDWLDHVRYAGTIAFVSDNGAFAGILSDRYTPYNLRLVEWLPGQAGRTISAFAPWSYIGTKLGSSYIEGDNVRSRYYYRQGEDLLPDFPAYAIVTRAMARSAPLTVALNVSNGAGSNQPAVWTSSGGLRLLESQSSGFYTHGVRVISSNGQYVGGSLLHSNGTSRSCVWNLQSGLRTDAPEALVGNLGRFEIGFEVHGQGNRCVNDGGSFALGYVTNGRHAAVWHLGTSTITRIVDLLETSNVLTPGHGWWINDIRAASANGETLVAVASIPELTVPGGGFRQVIITGLPLAQVQPVADQDGDGLLDDWEINGIPYEDLNGVARRFVLVGANPKRKDIYVEVDMMAERTFHPDAIEMLRNAFNTAPVPPPQGVDGGLPGIALHIEIDPLQARIPLDHYEDTWAEFDRDKDAHFGSAEERSVSMVWPRLKEAKSKAYRYCIVGNTFRNSRGGRGTSGIAEGFVCNDFLVTLGAVNAVGHPVYPTSEGLPGGSVQEQAGTFMHELGHTLGLHHGGTGEGGDINRKPNYYSVMNYWWQMPHEYNPAGQNGTWELVYSTVALPTLNEAALLEADGIGADLLGRRVPFSVPHGTGRCISINGSCMRWAELGANKPVDWNDDGDPITPGSVEVNINTRYGPDNTPPRQLLKGHDDWANLQYNFRNSPQYVEGASRVEMEEEFSELDVELHASLLAPCVGDADGDFRIGVPDIISVFREWGKGSPSGIAYGDANHDGWVDFADVTAILRNWKVPCEE